MTWIVGFDGVVLGHGSTKGDALQAADKWSARSNPLESAVLLEATPALAAVLASPCAPPHPRYRVRSEKADVP